MQRQFTIELRVDYADNEKNEAMRTAVAAAGRHVYATAELLSDGVKPQIAIYSDDFYVGREQIELLHDVVQQGLESTKGIATTEEGVSSELMEAVRAAQDVAPAKE